MRIFLAGATGAIGRRLVPMLREAGHEVTGTTRTEQRAQALRQAGADAVVVDALERDAIHRAVREARPEVVIHELTAIPAALDPRRIRQEFDLTDRLRTEGTRHLVDAAVEAGAGRLIAQSVAFAYAPFPDGDWPTRSRLHEESDPLNLDPPASFRRTARALATLERAVTGHTDIEGVVLRYGYFYGPGTAYALDGSMTKLVHGRRLPVVGGGAGVWSFIHIDDAARATVAALSGPPGIYNIVDDEPAPVREWVPAYAAAVGAPKPMHVPALLARPLAGAYGIHVMTRAEGASNERAKRELGWTPRYESWREGFRMGLG